LIRHLQHVALLFRRETQDARNVACPDVSERSDTRQLTHRHADRDGFVECGLAKGAILSRSEPPNRVVLVTAPVAPKGRITSEKLRENELAHGQRAIDAVSALELTQRGDDGIDPRRVDEARNLGTLGPVPTIFPSHLHHSTATGYR
jgi:hypothetical protein